ncbi:hypothetical protein H5410_021107 [Solanum commersonii]|uniref:Uncharacterized protein n=1 Tax=Solanum commersonii TaxID=4109 RepID=A0A9J5ZB11_SOLCO|nr:hypothetical protein H5410_021107 [Solanum commersonii]
MLSPIDASYNRVLTESPILIPEAKVVDETPIHRIRRPGRYNTSPYIRTFESSSSIISTLYICSSKLPKWLREGLLARHKNKINDDDRYKKKKATLTELMNFGICTISNKNWFYKLANPGQLLDDSEKRESTILATHTFNTVDCYFITLIHNIWEIYFETNGLASKANYEETILEYINGYMMHVVVP